MKIFKNKKINGFIFGMILGIVITSGVGVVAIELGASGVTYSPDDENFKKNDGTEIVNTEEALDVLYGMAQNQSSIRTGVIARNSEDPSTVLLLPGTYTCYAVAYTNGDYPVSANIKIGSTVKGGASVSSKGQGQSTAFNIKLSKATKVTAESSVSENANFGQNVAMAGCFKQPPKEDK